jgi:hypothetical protein
MGYFPINQVKVSVCCSHIPERLCNVGSPKPRSGVVLDISDEFLWSLTSFDKFNASPSTAVNNA